MNTWLEFDEGQMRAEFNRRAFPFKHRLHESGLFELPRLAKLAEFLFEQGGPRDVYNAAAGKRFGQAFAKNGERGLEPGRAINEIETSDSWMVLKRVERDPDFRQLVDECLAQVAAVVPELRPERVKKAEGFIFVTSPGGITPFHIDPQWSFLAQIRGDKTYRIYDVLDHDVISPGEIEDYYSGNVMAAHYAPEKDAKATIFALKPGMCANQPLHAPHSAHVGDDAYSISFSLAVVSDAWATKVPVHLANRFLRRMGMNPSPVGASQLADGVKSFTYRASAKLMRMLRSPGGAAR